LSSEQVAVPVAFPGLSLNLSSEALVLRSNRPLRFITSAVIGGGLSRAEVIVSLRVPRNFDCGRPAVLLRREAARRGISGRFVGFLTALDLRRAAVCEADDPRVLVVVTAGTSNAATPGRGALAPAQPGTINIVALVDGRLAPAARVAAVQTVTEAKTLALLEAGVHTSDGGIATGTSTDATAIGWTGTEAYHEYAGPATPLGHTLGRLVTAAVRHSLAGGMGGDRNADRRG
jgi:adenosylcobinamide hydrolase